MIKLKYQLATIATAALAANAYAQPVVPDDTQAPNQCPAPSGSTSSAQCPAPTQPLQQPQQQQPTAYQPPPPPPESTYVEPEKPWWDRQFAISVGGGVDDFAQSNAKRFTST